jgi:hypothetical protein
VLRRAAALALAGVVLGVLGAAAASTLLAGLLYGVLSSDARSLRKAVTLFWAESFAGDGHFPDRVLAGLADGLRPVRGIAGGMPLWLYFDHGQQEDGDLPE